MKGAKINLQSPITKRMNELAVNAIDQMDFIKRKIEAQKGLRDTLWLQAQGRKMKEESVEDSILGEPVPENAKAVLH